MEKRLITYNDDSEPARLGDLVYLKRAKATVVECTYTNALLLKVDFKDLEEGDLSFIRALGLTIANPELKEVVSIEVPTFKEELSDFFKGREKKSDKNLFFARSPEDPREVIIGGRPLFGVAL